MNEFTREEVEAELLRRQQQPAPSIVDRVFGDIIGPLRAMAGGAAGSAWMPATLADLFTKDQPVQQMMRSSGVAESSFPGQETAYRFGEGFAPGMIGGAAVGGPLVGVGAGLVGGLANVGAKAAFPESPTMQAALNLIPGVVTGIRSGIRTSVPEVPPMTVDPVTGVPLTPGQMGGNQAQLLREEALRKNIRTSAIAENFYKAQANTVEEFANNLQDISNKLPPEQVKNFVQKGFERYNKNLLTNFKASNRYAFNAAKEIQGDVIPTNNVRTTVNNLLAQYGDNLEVGENRAIVDALNRIQDYLLNPQTSNIIGPSGQPIAARSGDMISVDRLQQNLASLGEIAYTGRGTFGKASDPFTASNVSPGMSKGIATQLLNSFRSDLDEAARSNIQGAQLLRDARTQYSAGLDILNQSRNDYANQYFLKKDMNKTTPENLLSDLARFNPSQRVALADIMEKDYPQIYDNTRALVLTRILDKYRKGDGFDLTGLFKDNPFRGDNEWIFKDAAEKGKVKALVNVLDNIERRTKSKDLSQEELNKALKTASEVAGGFFGATGKYSTQAVVNSLRLLVGQSSSDNQKAALMFFTPSGQQAIMELSKPRPELRNIPKSFADSLIAGGMGAASQARDVRFTAQEGKKQEEQVEFTPEEIEAELRRRGAVK
jgi:hypothetical protein